MTPTRLLIDSTWSDDKFEYRLVIRNNLMGWWESDRLPNTKYSDYLAKYSLSYYEAAAQLQVYNLRHKLNGRGLDRSRDSGFGRSIPARNRYGKYAIPWRSSYRPAARRILSGQVWEPETIDFITSHCGTGDIVHAGTYFGDFLPALSAALSSGTKVWAFEPNPENYLCARQTIACNGIINISLHSLGLSDRFGMAPLRIEGGNNYAMGGASQVLEEGWFGSIWCPVVRLDDVIPSDRGISIVHLDVEGSESLALAGAIETIRRCRPILILESTLSPWLYPILAQIGYQKERQVCANTVWQVS